MDSADEEPQLPSAIQDLIWRLEGKGEPITRLPDFGRQGSLSTDTWWRSHVRHAVLKAIGNCNTLEYLEIHYLCGGHISRLTDSEWDEVLSGFRSSTVLRVLSLVDLTWNSVEEVESLCLKLGTILNTSSVANLAIISCKLSAICYLNLASGMRGKSECKLKSLDLHNAAWEDSSALEHVTDMINSATRLEMLSLGGTNGHMCDMDEEVVRTLSQAINLSSSIKTLKLVCANSGASDLLREVFASDDGNRSIEHLQMMHMPVRGHSLRDLLIYKEVKLKEVKLYNIDMFPEEWRAVGQAIRVNNTVKTIQVSNVLDAVSGPGGPLEGLEEIARAASSHDKDPIMEVTLNGKFENLSELNILGKVLRGEIKSVKSFRLSWGKFSISGTDNFQERLESIFPINRKSGDASVLESLELYPRENTLNGIWWKHLFLFLRGNTSLTHLTLGAHVDKLALNEEAFRELMGLLQVNLSLREIDVRETSWAMDGKAAQIVEALKQNERRAVYMSVFRETKLAFGDARAGRLFLCGSPGAALGQDFQAKEYRTSRHDLHTSRDGFVSEKVFADLIQKFLGKQPRGEQVVNRELIEDILINLDLCFKLENTSKYFIPSFIPEHASLEEQKYQEGAHVELKAWETRVETSKFVGIRIQCQDERTMSLSAAFFPCFQMFMRRKLMSETMTCSRHYLRLFHDGHEIYVEQDKSHNFVDVLMLYSKHKSREGALKYAMKHIVQELISFCASPKGCPGVALVLGVIQTICVKMLIPSQLRGAILIEDLKSKFIRNINDKLEDIPLEKSLLEKEDELFNYEHSWPLIRDHTTQVIFERARELLWDSDVEAVVNETRQKRMQQLESLQQGLIQQVESLQRTMNNDLVQTQPSNRPSSRLLSRASTSVGNRSTRLVLSTIHQLREDLVQRFDGVDEGLKSVVSIVERLEKKPRAPKRPYVTDDVGIFCRAGLEKTVGLGQAIPDWADLKSDIVQLDVSDRDRVAVVKVGESKELKEAWLRIQQTLEHVNYSAKFKLYQVNYVRPELGGHAWVCEECMNKGRASGILTD
ncbi:hypothetical protein AXG93_977s1220 [Marchantia polymorpha subsp. ruderalis]|uniref:Uncharacterized protein n=1 Tax=Marchantia polymorpha subsp. ruderalis TaxID=1480154 RepID=A0A176WEH4_MARPO|nr:hypothetical protein AXG93_977s1220 [Marchantia polymorpha subsp. ruderalis]